MTNDYELADKLKKQFSGRGAAVSGIEATSASELLKRASSGKDPSVNVSEEAFRENWGARRMNARENGIGSSSPSRDPSRPRSGPAPQSGGDRINEEITRRNHIPYGGRRPGSDPSRPGVRTASAAAGRPGKAKRAKKTAKPRVRGNRRVRAEAPRNDEIRVRGGRFPFAAVAVCLIVLIFVFSVVQSWARVYQTSNRISQLTSDLDALNEKADRMKLKLEEKNDIRNIWDIAVGDLGMAKEDSLQRRFVSISDGERIEILEAEEEKPSPGGVLFSVFDSLIEPFR